MTKTKNLNVVNKRILNTFMVCRTFPHIGQLGTASLRKSFGVFGWLLAASSFVELDVCGIGEFPVFISTELSNVCFSSFTFCACSVDFFRFMFACSLSQIVSFKLENFLGLHLKP